MTTSATLLRDALSSAKEGKDISREAGAGIWGNYVRAICSQHGQEIMVDGQQFAVRHAALMEELETIKPLTKEEKNSLASAKCVIKKVCEAEKSLNVWQYDADGKVVRDDFGYMQPVGKSELQDAKSDAQRMLASIAAMTKKLQSDSIEMTGQEAAEVARALQTLTADVWQFGANVEGEDAAQFMIDNAVA
jgi:Mg2+ and Co2+ transporter CorA